MNEKGWPFIQWFVRDWLGDPKVSMCSPATRGVLFDWLCNMHLLDRSGQITGTREQLARAGRCTAVECDAALRELVSTNAAEVIERNGTVTVMNRRMKRESDSRRSGTIRQKNRRENLSKPELSRSGFVPVTGHNQNHNQSPQPESDSQYPKLKGRGGVGEEPPRPARPSVATVPPANDDKLSDANSLETARAILSQAAINGTFYDNCQVKPEMFTIGALRTVLREFYGRAALIWLPLAFQEAVSTAHGRCIDGINNERLEPVEKPGGLAIEIFRERLEFRIKQAEEKR